MRFALLLVLGVVLPLACTETGPASSGTSGSGGNASMSHSDAAIADAALLTDGMAGAGSGGSGGMGSQMGPDGSPFAHLRTCSGNPLDTVVWPCDPMAGTCPTSMRISQSCPLPWGCDEYSLAVVAAQAQCSPFSSVIVAQACERTVIELHVWEAPPLRAFYTGGGLMGTWSIGDESTSDGAALEQCSGFVPKDCLDADGESLSDVVDLCAAFDAGPQSDLDAGDAQ